MRRIVVKSGTNHRSFSRGAATLWFALSLAGFPLSSYAVGQELTDSEWQMLPEFCRHKAWVSVNHKPLPGHGEWEATQKDAYLHMHHYCWSLIDYMRSWSPRISALERDKLLIEVVGGIDYVFTNAGITDFPEAAEMLTLRGKARVRQGKLEDAVLSFQRAVTVDSKYWQAYLNWALLLQQVGRKDQALKVAELGVANAPDATALQTLIKDLQGHKGSTRPTRKGAAEQVGPHKDKE